MLSQPVKHKEKRMVLVLCLKKNEFAQFETDKANGNIELQLMKFGIKRIITIESMEKPEKKKGERFVSPFPLCLLLILKHLHAVPVCA